MTAFLHHQSGERIQDRYEVLGELGSGAFGTVYKCRDSELDTLVAIKELHVLDEPSSAVNEREAALAQFRREAVNLSHLRHPHIVSGHYQPHAGTWLACPVCGETFRGATTCPRHNAAPIVVRQRHYLVMEYLDGPDLSQAAKAEGGALGVERALRYIQQVAEALRMIHARHLLHRDIKPENVRLRVAGDDAVLLDFGIATQTGEAGDFSTRQHRHTSGGGTLGYAPESPSERRLPDARSDIHALGMTLYAILSGRDPLESDDLIAMRAHRPRDFNTNIPPHIELLIQKSIDSNPANRPADAAAFLRELNAPVANAAVTPVAAPNVAVAAPTTVANAPSVAVAPPFAFRSGARATDVGELVRLMDKDRQEAREYLYSGDLAQWLAGIGRADLAQRAREIVHEYPDRKYQGLEALAQATGLAEPPTLDVTPAVLDFGTIPHGARKTLVLKLRNIGRGHLFGILRSSLPGLFFEDKFEGNRHTVPITFDARDLPSGAHQGELVVDSSAGELRLPVAVQVQNAASFAASVTVMLWGVLGMLSGQLLRALPTSRQFAGSGDAQEWLTSTHAEAQNVALDLPFASHVVFGAAVWMVLLVLTGGEATRRKSWTFLFSAGALSLPLAMLCAVVTGPLLTVGDGALQFLEPLLPGRAADGWMITGGLLGALYGTLRRLDDVFSRRLPQVLLGWLFFTLTLSGVLFLVRAVVPALG